MRWLVSIVLFIVLDILLSWLLGMAVEWIIELSLVWYTIVIMCGSGLLVYIIGVYAQAVAYIICTNGLRLISCTILPIYLLLTGIIRIYYLNELVDFGITKQAIVGILVILFLVGKFNYVYKVAKLAEDGGI